MSGEAPAFRRWRYGPAMLRRLLPALPLLVACAGPAVLPPSAPSPLLHRDLPRFHRPTLAGTSVDTASLAGHITVVKFFAAYCAPCQRTLPEAEALHRDRPDVAFIGVSEDEHEDDAVAQVQRYALTFPVVRDAGNVLAGRFRVTELPATFVVGRGGRVVWVGGSTQESGTLRQALEALR